MIDALAALMVGLLVIGVPAGIAYSVWHYRRRDRACRRTAARHGFAYRSRTEELCDAELAKLERFTACDPAVATRADFRCVFARPGSGEPTSAAYVFDYHTRGTPGSPGALFHGTWYACREAGLQLPVTVVAPGVTLRDTLDVAALPEGYAAWGRRVEGRWIDAERVHTLARALSPWLREERARGRLWHLELGGPWICARHASAAPVARYRHLEPEAAPKLFEEGARVSAAVRSAHGGRGRP